MQSALLLRIASLVCVQSHSPAKLRAASTRRVHAMCAVHLHCQTMAQLCRAIADWVSTLGKRLLSGNGLSSTPAPVAIFEPRSNLQKLTDPWVYTAFLDAAAREADPVAKLQLVAAWFVAGTRHMFDTWRKPFNPVLGETWQCHDGEAGCTGQLEQTSHHPPVASFTLSGAGWSMEGTAELLIQVCWQDIAFVHAVLRCGRPVGVSFMDKQRGRVVCICHSRL